MMRKLLRLGMHSPLAMATALVGLFIYQGVSFDMEVNSESYRTTAPVKRKAEKRVAAPAKELATVAAVASGPEIAPAAGCPIDPLGPADHLAYEAEQGPVRGGGRKGLLQRFRDR